MIKRTLGCVALFGWLMAASGSLQAHHSLAGVYDMKGDKELSGAVESVKFVNPHGSLTVSVKNADGTSQEWMVEAGTPNTLFRRGLTKDSLPVGTEIVVDGYQAKDGSFRCNGRDLTFPDGRKLFLGNQGGAEGAPDAGK